MKAREALASLVKGCSEAIADHRIPISDRLERCDASPHHSFSGLHVPRNRMYPLATRLLLGMQRTYESLIDQVAYFSLHSPIVSEGVLQTATKKNMHHVLRLIGLPRCVAESISTHCKLLRRQIVELRAIDTLLRNMLEM